MNEEELINKVLRELDINPEWHKKQELKKTYGSKFVNSVIKLSFQKGKLEQKKEDKNKQDEFYNEFDLASNCSKDDKLFKKLWNKYFKQLKKEIGGKRE